MKAKEIIQQVKNNFHTSDKPIEITTTSTIKRKAIKRGGGGCCMK
ncbi:hypothetical protein ACFOZ1_10865 [Gracilibacillus marinus]|uniref:Uncharacterized protein n=1 Tax=Gracilibacillus marinus TaxID=630535 RepID=A0ABV8VWP6_9BACI